MKQLQLILLIILTFDLSAQIYPTVKSNEYKSEIVDFIKSKKSLKDYDFILIKHEYSCWINMLDFRLVCLKSNQCDLMIIKKKLKSNRFKIVHKEKRDFELFKTLIDSLNKIGLFNLRDSDFVNQHYDKTGNVSILDIVDGESEIFEVYSSKGSWGLGVYEPRRFYDFYGNKNYLIVINSIDLFEQRWKK